MVAITIITVTRNDLEGLKLTAASILPHLSNDVFWIVVDGASSDGTASYIASLGDYIYWTTSKPDKGIYDAMNIGGLHSPEKSFLVWINSGDQLTCVPHLTDEYDAYFFGVVIKETGQSKLPSISARFGLKSISPYSQFFHQGFFIAREIFMNYKYDLRIGLSGDMLLMLQVVKSHEYKVINDVAAIYSAEGQSNTRVLSLLSSHFAVVRYFGLSVIKYCFLNKNFIVKSVIKAVVPFSWVIFYRKLLVR